MEPYDKVLLKSINYTDDQISTLTEQLKDQPYKFYHIFGIKPNGDIFGITKSDLRTEKYIQFYNSRIINRLSAPNINKKCILPTTTRY